MGRGKSLNRIEELSKLPITECCTSNNFDTEIRSKEICEFFEGKKCIAFIGRSKGAISSEGTYKKMNVKKIVLNIFPKEYKRSRHRKKLKSMGIDYDFLVDAMKKPSLDGKGGFPTTGILSLVYVAVVLKKKVIDIIGIDFYSAGYFNKTSAKPHQVEKGKTMRKFFLKFVKSHPDIQFNLYTHAKFSSDLKNLRII